MQNSPELIRAYITFFASFFDLRSFKFKTPCNFFYNFSSLFINPLLIISSYSLLYSSGTLPGLVSFVFTKLYNAKINRKLNPINKLSPFLVSWFSKGIKYNGKDSKISIPLKKRGNFESICSYS